MDTYSKADFWEDECKRAKRELEHWKTMASINEPGQKQVHSDLVESFKALQVKNEQLKARVLKLETALTLSYDLVVEAMESKQYDWHQRAISSTNESFRVLRNAVRDN